MTKIRVFHGQFRLPSMVPVRRTATWTPWTLFQHMMARLAFAGTVLQTLQDPTIVGPSLWIATNLWSSSGFSPGPKMSWMCTELVHSDTCVELGVCHQTWAERPEPFFEQFHWKFLSAGSSPQKSQRETLQHLQETSLIFHGNIINHGNKVTSHGFSRK